MLVLLVELLELLQKSTGHAIRHTYPSVTVNNLSSTYLSFPQSLGRDYLCRTYQLLFMQ